MNYFVENDVSEVQLNREMLYFIYVSLMARKIKRKYMIFLANSL